VLEKGGGIISYFSGKEGSSLLNVRNWEGGGGGKEFQFHKKVLTEEKPEGKRVYPPFLQKKKKKGKGGASGSVSGRNRGKGPPDLDGLRAKGRDRGTPFLRGRVVEKESQKRKKGESR